jgi:prepilin-type N-terminal cleavage/methylation domain-containing protein/prepilin-type processing-associated H-X9-DG protein
MVIIMSESDKVHERQPPPLKSKVLGFTLIELLVVLGVLALLAGLLLSVFASVRSRGKQTSCMSNLRQLGLAVSQYANDYDGYIPPYATYFAFNVPPNTGFTDHAAALISAMQPYTSNKDIWYCPSDIFARTADTDLGVNHLYTSYGTGRSWYTLTPSGPQLGETRIDTPQSFHPHLGSAAPGDRPLFSDEVSNCSAAYPPNDPAASSLPPYSHDGRFNAVLFDGHAVSFSFFGRNCLLYGAGH